MSIDMFERLPEEKKQLIVENGLKEFAEKNYQDANNDLIAKNCGISKGSLYHYFEHKKGFYLYLLKHCLMVTEGLAEVNTQEGRDFYGILFDSLNSKLVVRQRYPLEVAFLISAAKERCAEVYTEKQQLLSASMQSSARQSGVVLQAAAEKLRLKERYDVPKALRVLSMYVGAITMQYLEQYQQNPDAFFENQYKIRAELKEYLDMLLYGIAKEEV